MLLAQVCKTTLGHDGHVAVELSAQAQKDADYIRALNANLDRAADGVRTKMDNIRIEEQITLKYLKDIHKVGW